jgi:hypothetical protein
VARWRQVQWCGIALPHQSPHALPETYHYSKDPEFKKKFRPRGVIKSNAGGKIEDTGPLNMKRMKKRVRVKGQSKSSQSSASGPF